MDTGGAQTRDATDSEIAKKGRIEGQMRRYCCEGFSNGSFYWYFYEYSTVFVLIPIFLLTSIKLITKLQYFQIGNTVPHFTDTDVKLHIIRK